MFNRLFVLSLSKAMREEDAGYDDTPSARPV